MAVVNKPRPRATPSGYILGLGLGPQTGATPSEWGYTLRLGLCPQSQSVYCNKSLGQCYNYNVCVYIHFLLMSVTHINSRNAWFTLSSLVTPGTLGTIVSIVARKPSVTRWTLRGDGRR